MPTKDTNVETAKHTTQSNGEKLEAIHDDVKSILGRADKTTDKVLAWIEKSGFSVVIIGAWSVICLVIGARLF